MSEFKTDKIIPVDAGGTTTIGCTGDTIATGAGTTLNIQGTYSGINSISWDTTAKTANFTAETNKGYFINTTSGSVTITLPATPVVGSFIGIKDYALTAQTNPIIINANGNKIQGSTTDFEITTQGGAANLVYVDSTQGWLTYDAGQASDITESAAFIVATGGTITCCGDYKIHTFTSPGTFTVCSVGNPLGSDSVDYVVLAGGGGGGYQRGGGGGAGGYREGYNPGSYTASPLATSALPVTATGYPITVGGGGVGGTYPSTQSTNGSNSIFSTITSAGGGASAEPAIAPARNGQPGGSGGGGVGSGGNPCNAGGTGNTPPVSPPQGNNGGAGSPSAFYGAGGGGGAGTAGTAGSGPFSGPGGNGVTSSINASPVTRGGGGGGSHFTACGTPGTGGTGGGGNSGTAVLAAVAGGTNLGGGGGGGAFTNTTNTAPTDQGANGGSGIVIIRYKYQ